MCAAPRSIRPLDDHLVNQIAAGEVVERPASVVKELLENAIDAGAGRIDIELVDGGTEFIAVTDDGCGIRAEELAHAFRRHWTSKISAPADLDAIASLGFRGEALASIAAVAEVVATSRTADAQHAWSVALEAGREPPAPRPARGNPGTRIEVRRLFHRVPARRRFLKQPRTEFLHVQRLVRQYAFARPDIAFSLAQPAARGLHLRPAKGDADARWRTLFGRAFLARAVVIDERAEGIGVTGWIGGPELATAQSELQYLALNGRVIRDRHLQHAIRLAFGEAIAPGRFPAYALALTVAPGAVDVNVHPAKLEVRFAELRTVHDILLLAVRRAIAGALSGGAAAPAAAAAGGPAGGSPSEAYAATPSPYRAPAARRASGHAAPAPADVGSALGQVLAVVDGRQLLYRRGEAVYALDLERAWNAVLAQRLATADGASRPLLLPVRAQPPGAAARGALGALGFEFDVLGPAGAVLRAVPQVLPPLDHARLLDALDALDSGGGEAPLPARVAAAAASAIRRGEAGAAARETLAALVAGAAAAAIDLHGGATRLTADALASLHAREPGAHAPAASRQPDRRPAAGDE